MAKKSLSAQARDGPPTRKAAATLWDAGTKPGTQCPHREGYRKQTLGMQVSWTCWVGEQREWGCRGSHAHSGSGRCWNWELERTPSAGAQHVRATALDKYWVASSLDGQDDGAHNVHTREGWGEECREAVTWAGQRPPIPPPSPELDQARNSQRLEKAVPHRLLVVQGQKQVLPEPGGTNTRYPGNQEGKSLPPAKFSSEPST